MQISQAFLEVTRSLNWLVDNFPKLADWRSHVERVVELEDSFDAPQVMEGEDGIRIEEGPLPDGDEVLAFRHLQIGQVEGNVIIDQADAEIRAGEKVLIVGESGTGKSTLFRAIAGLWPWGSGEIRTPPRDAMMFMPQRPYLPLGSLRAAIAYPAPARRFPDAAIRAALERAGCRTFPPAGGGGAMGPHPLARGAAAACLRAPAAAPAALGVHGRGDGGAGRGEPGRDDAHLLGRPRRQRADLDRSPARPRRLSRPDAASCPFAGRGAAGGAAARGRRRPAAGTAAGGRAAGRGRPRRAAADASAAWLNPEGRMAGDHLHAPGHIRFTFPLERRAGEG
jgi:energy-coupling factor transporter ATP-binding protein EcfA2